MQLSIKRLLATLFLPVVFAAATENPTVKVATLFWEPYISTNAAAVGPATELVKAAFALSDIQAEITIMPWIEAIEKTEQGIYEAIYPAYFSVERMGKYLISEPFLCSPVVLVTRADSNITYEGINSLSTYRLAVVAGYANAEELDDAKGLNKITSKSDFDSMKMLKNGTVDLAVFDELIAIALLRTHPDILGAFEEYAFLTPSLGNRDMYVMFPKCLKDSATRVERFNKGLKQLQKDGTAEAIIQKYGFR